MEREHRYPELVGRAQQVANAFARYIGIDEAPNLVFTGYVPGIPAHVTAGLWYTEITVVCDPHPGVTDLRFFEVLFVRDERDAMYPDYWRVARIRTVKVRPSGKEQEFGPHLVFQKGGEPSFYFAETPLRPDIYARLAETLRGPDITLLMVDAG